MINWSSSRRKIEELKPAAYNPRQATETDCQQLRRSLSEFNLADPIIINLDNTVIGGHFRLKILKEQGVTEVDVRVPDRLLTPTEEMTLNLRLNKNNGQWDLDALANFDEDMLKDVGWTPDELDRIFQLDMTKAEKADLAPACRATEIKRGDLIVLGRHRLMCGSATEPKDLERLMNGARAQMIFTDPPYNVDYKGGTLGERETIENDKMERSEFYDFLHAACVAMIEHVDGALYICMGSSEMDTLKQAFERGGGALVEHDHLGKKHVHFIPQRLSAPIRADSLRLAGRQQAPFHRPARPFKRLGRPQGSQNHIQRRNNYDLVSGVQDQNRGRSEG